MILTQQIERFACFVFDDFSKILIGDKNGKYFKY
jgi:hypothetical protein